MGYIPIYIIGEKGTRGMDNPKSIAFKAAVSFLFSNKKFSGLRSRCITPCLWHI
ncbi:hypothetical protein HanIR_Chr01g0014541 [Helianthus annuus]|nr:hypothetical protein HanIR_Chr01g0014541 [Helianthus annuus]